ncbi:MAG: ribonuclease R [SAR324 cluster bacterium]|nr:ribonuclease R [SAR324 cluster bacterium]
MKLNKRAVLRLMEAQGVLLSAKQLRGLLGLKKSQATKLKAWLQKQVQKGSLIKLGVRYGSARLLEQAPEAPSEEGQSSKVPKVQSSKGAKFQREGREPRADSRKPHRGSRPSPRSSERLQGRFERSRRGFGFVIVGSDQPDIFVGEEEQSGAMDGDTVEVELLRRRGFQGRRKGVIVRILKRATSTLLARLERKKSSVSAIPVNPNSGIAKLRIPLEHDDPEILDKTLVEVELVESGSSMSRTPQGRIVRSLAEVDLNELAFERILQENQVRTEYPEAALAHAARFSTRISFDPKSGRTDLRGLPFVTIDGRTARDFDDAVCAEELDGGRYRLHVAIADVAHYVQPGDPVDAEAVERATSVYFPTHAVPMLPEALSNELCSLRPGVNRLVLACTMEITPEGEVADYTICEGLIRSRARLVYDDVEELLQGRPSPIRSPELQESLRLMHKLSQLLERKRGERGAIQFSFAEETIEVDTENRMTGVSRREQNSAMRLIEQFMLEANETVARHCVRHKLPALYRVHEQPDPIKLKKLQRVFWRFGVTTPMARLQEPSAFNEVFEQIRELPVQEQLQVLLLRCMALAVYRTENLGHFGLAAEFYAHFTSPIRRYPDLCVHRGLKHWLAQQRLQGLDRKERKRLQPPSPEVTPELAEQCSQQERKAEKAEIQSIDLLKVSFLERFLGEGFTATVRSISNAGIKVQLAPHEVEWFLPLETLTDDWYSFDEETLTLLGRRRQRIVQVGDRLQVRLLRADVLQRTLDFEAVRWLS